MIFISSNHKGGFINARFNQYQTHKGQLTNTHKYSSAKREQNDDFFAYWESEMTDSEALEKFKGGKSYDRFSLAEFVNIVAAWVYFPRSSMLSVCY
jgi:cytoplasmic iron level regulating protein YaaA (DUF328/UPF0246 family)